MEILIDFQDSLLRSVKNDFRRYLHGNINWKQRMIGIKGPRGAGKTTLLLQHLKFDLGVPATALYITADHTCFTIIPYWKQQETGIRQVAGYYLLMRFINTPNGQGNSKISMMGTPICKWYFPHRLHLIFIVAKAI